MSASRRLFLKSTAIALAGLAPPPFLLRSARAQASDRVPENAPTLIAIFQRGAMDGISAVAPYGDPNYAGLRPDIAIPAPGGGDSAIDLDGYFALHPALAPFKPLWDGGSLAIVHAVGSPSGTRSHFDAQDYMESATPDNKGTPDGWLNRYLRARGPGDASPFRAVSFTRNLPRSFLGPAPAIAMTNLSDFGIRAAQETGYVAKGFEEIYALTLPDELYGAGKEALRAGKLLKTRNPQQQQPANGAQYPRSPFGNALLQIAQLIKSDVGVEVAFADIGGWDTHANQGASQGQLAKRLLDFGQGIAALHADLGDRMRNVVILTMTEFGRTIRQNGSGGTDHGHASCMFVAGGPVRGGKVYGRWPGLALEQLHEGRDLAVTTDFRDVFAEIAARHMGATDLNAILPNFNPNPARFLRFVRT